MILCLTAHLSEVEKITDFDLSLCPEHSLCVRNIKSCEYYCCCATFVNLVTFLL